VAESNFLDVFRSAYEQGNEAFNRGDFQTAFGGLPDEFEFYTWPDSPEPGPHRGPGGVIRFFTDLRATLGGWSAKPTEYIDAGNGIVIVAIAVSGMAESVGLYAGGMGFQVWETRDLVPLRCREFASRKEALEAAGLAA